MTKYYIDACIWRDYLEDRQDRFRPLGEWAFRFIRKIVEEEGQFIVSDLLVKELNRHLTSDEVTLCLSIVPEELIMNIKITEAQEKRAHKIKHEFGINFSDALHVVLVKDNDAILITRDKHFDAVQEYICVKKPEDSL